MTKFRRLTLVDLFAGCGGLSLGLERAGFDPVYVNELNDDARETYFVNREKRYPHIRKYSSADILTAYRQHDFFDDLLSGIRRDYGIRRADPIDLLVGGPPCQGFSSLGLRRSYSVEKAKLRPNHLYRTMARFVRKLKPRAFLFENVQGLLTSRWTAEGRPGEIYEDVLGSFSRIEGYEVRTRLVRAKQYGVPQNRPRIIIVGIRNEFAPGLLGSADAVEAGFLPQASSECPSMSDALSDLVDPHFEYGGRTERYPHRAQSEFQLRMRRSSGGRKLSSNSLSEHEYSNHSERIKRKFELMIKYSGRIRTAYKTKKFNQRVLPFEWGEAGPNITITSNPDDFVHYCQARSLTVRECARLQTFPDWYRFVGPRTTGGVRRAGNPIEGNFRRNQPKYTQVANAVPPDLAAAIGSHLANLLD